MAFDNGPKVVTNALVLALDAADRNSYPGSGTSWRDVSGNDNNGTLTNGPTFNSANGGSIVFDGVDDNVNCGNKSSLAITGDMSVSAWVYFNSFDTYCGIIGKTSGGIPAPYDYYSFINPGNSTTYMVFYRGNGGASFQFASSSININTNVWCNVAATMQGTSVTHYLNGMSNGTGTLSATIADGGTNAIVGNRADSGTDMNGRISNIQLYNRALSASEILQNYNATKTRFGL